MNPKVQVKPFSSTVDRSTFFCGVSDIDDWLKLYSGQSERKGETRTFLAISSEHVIGYVSLKAISIIATGPQELLNNRVPGVLIARLGVDLNWQGLGIGRTLLHHALETSIEVSRKVGIKLVAIEPYSSELCGYYERFGFEALGGESRMMVMKISKIKQAKLS